MGDAYEQKLNNLWKKFEHVPTLPFMRFVWAKYQTPKWRSLVFCPRERVVNQFLKKKTEHEVIFYISVFFYFVISLNFLIFFQWFYCFDLIFDWAILYHFLNPSFFVETESWNSLKNWRLQFFNIWTKFFMRKKRISKLHR